MLARHLEQGAAQEQGGGERGLFLHFLLSCLVPASHLYFVLSFLLGLLLQARCRSNKNYGEQTVAIHLENTFLQLLSSARLPLRFGDHFTA